MNRWHCWASLILLSLGCSARGQAAGPVPVSANGVVSALPAGFEGRQPQLAADPGDSTLYLVVGQAQGDVYCLRSTDGGGSFSTPVKVASLPGLALGLRRGPRVAAAAGHVTVTAISHRTGQLFAFSSTDQGRTWSAGVCINPGVGKSAEEGLHALAVRPRDGLLFVTWLDARSGQAEIYGSASADHGLTWSAGRLVYRSPDGHVCECCQPSAAFDARGALAVMWRNWLGGSRDLYVTVSDDGGQTFSVAVKQGRGTWKLNACPMDGGAVAALPGGGFGSVWQRDGSVYLARGDRPAANEKRLADGTQPVTVATPAGGLRVVWQEKGGGLFTMYDPADPLATTPNPVWAPRRLTGPEGSFVTLVNSPLDGQPVAAWESTGPKGDRQVCVRRLP